MTRKTVVGTAAAVLTVALAGGMLTTAGAQQAPATSPGVTRAAVVARQAQAATPSKAQVLTGAWNVDPAHTNVNFLVAHLGISKIHGRFNEFAGTVRIDGAKPQNSSVEFTIQTKSIDTGIAARDAHLRTPDFFDAEKYPTITFKSTRVTPAGRDRFTARGLLTLHGVTKSVELPITVQGPRKGMQGELRLGVGTSVKLDRRDYGINFNQVLDGAAMIGNEIDVAIHLELVKQQATPAAGAAKAASTR